jgi:hypothetical protein
MAIRAPKQIISFITAPWKITHLSQRQMKKTFLNSIMGKCKIQQNIETKLAPPHQTNQFCCVPPKIVHPCVAT